MEQNNYLLKIIALQDNAQQSIRFIKDIPEPQ